MFVPGDGFFHAALKGILGGEIEVALGFGGFAKPVALLEYAEFVHIERGGFASEFGVDGAEHSHHLHEPYRASDGYHEFLFQLTAHDFAELLLRVAS